MHVAESFFILISKQKFSDFRGIKRFVTQNLNGGTHNEPDEPCTERRNLSRLNFLMVLPLGFVD